MANEVMIIKKLHNCAVQLCDVGIMPNISISTLKNLTIGQILKHHNFILGAKSKDRSGQVTAAKRSLSPLLSLNPLVPSASCSDKQRDVSVQFDSTSSAQDILNNCDSHQQNKTSVGENAKRQGATPCVSEDKTADDIIISCETDNWDSDLASDNLMVICRRVLR